MPGSLSLLLARALGSGFVARDWGSGTCGAVLLAWYLASITEPRCASAVCRLCSLISRWFHALRKACTIACPASGWARLTLPMASSNSLMSRWVQRGLGVDEMGADARLAWQCVHVVCVYVHGWPQWLHLRLPEGGRYGSWLRPWIFSMGRFKASGRVSRLIDLLCRSSLSSRLVVRRAKGVLPGKLSRAVRYSESPVLAPRRYGLRTPSALVSVFKTVSDLDMSVSSSGYLIVDSPRSGRECGS